MPHNRKSMFHYLGAFLKVGTVLCPKYGQLLSPNMHNQKVLSEVSHPPLHLFFDN